MKIKMDNISILNYFELLNKFNFVTDKLGYAILRTKKNLHKEVEIINEARLKLFQKYGEYNEEDKTYTIPENSENYGLFARENLGIMTEIVDVDVHKISQDDFDKADIYNEKCSVFDYERLEEFMVMKNQQEPTDSTGSIEGNSAES